MMVACATAGRGLTMDLEAELREAYNETGAVTNHAIKIEGLQQEIRYLRAGPQQATKLVILLHGMAFSAATWKIVGTLDVLASAGIQVVALDLPGYGGEVRNPEVRRTLLRRFLAAYGWGRKVVIVAASAGGSVGSPYVLSAGNERIAGYVSVSAVLDDEGFNHSSVPALLVWGELDAPTSGKAKAHERLFSTHLMVVMPNAPHPCYLKDPGFFNARLLQFVGGALPSRGEVALKVMANWRPGAVQSEL